MKLLERQVAVLDAGVRALAREFGAAEEEARRQLAGRGHGLVPERPLDALEGTAEAKLEPRLHQEVDG